MELPPVCVQELRGVGAALPSLSAGAWRRGARWPRAGGLPPQSQLRLAARGPAWASPHVPAPGAEGPYPAGGRAPDILAADTQTESQ